MTRKLNNMDTTTATTRHRITSTTSSRMLLTLCLILSIFVTSTNSYLTGDCYEHEKEVEFVLYLDEDSWTEQGWFMQCGENVVWNNTVGFLLHYEEYLDYWNPVIRDQACVHESETCVFTIIDTWGDGLLTPGQFLLSYEATTIAIYTHTEPFEELSYCFGPLCS